MDRGSVLSSAERNRDPGEGVCVRAVIIGAAIVAAAASDRKHIVANEGVDLFQGLFTTLPPPGDPNLVKNPQGFSPLPSLEVPRRIDLTRSITGCPAQPESHHPPATSEPAHIVHTTEQDC